MAAAAVAVFKNRTRRPVWAQLEFSDGTVLDILLAAFQTSRRAMDDGARRLVWALWDSAGAGTDEQWLSLEKHTLPVPDAGATLPSFVLRLPGQMDAAAQEAKFVAAAIAEPQTPASPSAFERLCAELRQSGALFHDATFRPEDQNVTKTELDWLRPADLCARPTLWRVISKDGERQDEGDFAQVDSLVEQGSCGDCW